MRRVLLAVTLGLTLTAAAAGCADTATTDAQPSASAAASAGTTDPSAAASAAVTTGTGTGTADAKSVCAAVNKAGETFATTIVTKAQKAGEALSDSTKAKAFLDDLAKDYTTLSTALKAEAAKAADPALQKALGDMTKALDASQAALADPQQLAKDPSKIQDILFSADLTAAGEALDKICPSA
ncbi:hypothetical protein QEZ54_32140 [Catellatospora sp. KI3]|uniref:hypothetical protein n=1 Tax=Catellatospora sp. KI3 TaxID=3041620 RepID=UPI002482B06E|nr:hypothetical protein [Catellatospora sp. KI3]MDI1465631.1 hypothetical protein [Catellatospora sp. KI3]